jgi:hypothetical protein
VRGAPLRLALLLGSGIGMFEFRRGIAPAPSVQNTYSFSLPQSGESSIGFLHAVAARYGRGIRFPRTSRSPCQLAQRTFSHCTILMR